MTEHHAVLVQVPVVNAYAVERLDGTEAQEVYAERFGIDDARELVRVAYSRPATAAQQLLIVRSEFMTLEAQNALLKVLEEPPFSTRFVFVLPSSFTVIDTLLSRFAVEVVPEQKEKDGGVLEDFLTDTYAERLARIDQATKQKDHQWQQCFKRELTEYLTSRGGSCRFCQS